jgi:hypothetical protein
MPTRRERLKAIATVGGCIVITMFSLYELYCAWVYGTVRSGLIGQMRWVTYDAEPAWFVFGVATSILALVLFGVGLVLIVYFWWSDRLWLLNWKGRLLIDKAIRDSANRKS